MLAHLSGSSRVLHWASDPDGLMPRFGRLSSSRNSRERRRKETETSQFDCVFAHRFHAVCKTERKSLHERSYRAGQRTWQTHCLCFTVGFLPGFLSLKCSCSGQLYLHPHNSTEILEAGQSASMPSLNFAFLLLERIPTPLRIKTRRCFRQHWDESQQCSNKVSRTVHHIMSMIAYRSYRFPIVFPCFP